MGDFSGGGGSTGGGLHFFCAQKKGRPRTTAKRAGEGFKRFGLDFFDEEGGVVAAEAEGVGHGVIDFGTAGDVGDVVEIAFGVGFVVVDGGREVIFLESEGGDDEFDAAGGS